MFEEVGILVGVFNIIMGCGLEIGDYIIEYKEVNFINFIGLIFIGECIGCLVGMCLIMLEFGGKDAVLVLEDVDLEYAVK